MGSELRSDDVAGLLAARAIARAFRGREDLLVVEGGSAPENLTGPIVAFAPSHLVLIDCAEIDAPPGSIRLCPVGEIGGFASCTHSLPLGVVIDYIRGSCDCEVIVAGIRPESLEFDGEPTRAARRAARALARGLASEIRAMGRRRGRR